MAQLSALRCMQDEENTTFGSLPAAELILSLDAFLTAVESLSEWKKNHHSCCFRWLFLKPVFLVQLLSIFMDYVRLIAAL